MPPVNILIKPASGNCNLSCSYCFYADEMKNRKTGNFGKISQKTADHLIEKSFTYATDLITFAFQGGEPMLMGLEFFKYFCQKAEKENKKNIDIQYALQTNGTLIDEAWADFFHDHMFLVGISLDGPRSIHDKCRLDVNREGTFKTVLKAAKLLQEKKVDFNILTVLTEYTAMNIEKVYKFFMARGFYYQQYIPCLNPFNALAPNESLECESYALTPDTYAKCLKTLFDLWYQDITHETPVYNRYFENLIGILAGFPPESCDMGRHCSIQYVIEADGSVYPCDFYVLDEFLIGNINEMSFEEINATRKSIQFLEHSMEKDISCSHCKWETLCQGGCRRNREQPGHQLGLNRFCSANKEFFPYAIERLSQLAKTVR